MTMTETPSRKRRALSPATIIERLSKLPIIAEYERREIEESHKVRMGLGLERNATVAQRTEQLAKLEAAVVTAGKALAKLLPAYNAAIAAVSDAQNAYARAYADFDARITRINHQLQSTSDPIIADYTNKLIDLLDEARSIRLLRTESFRKRVPGNPSTVFVHESNAESVAKRILAITAAIRSIDDFRLEPNQLDIEARLEELLAGLPTVEMTEIVHEEPAAAAVIKPRSL